MFSLQIKLNFREKDRGFYNLQYLAKYITKTYIVNNTNFPQWHTLANEGGTIEKGE
jgi:hypothetical protein